ncbi:nucleoside monophosphate kinase [Candidatus Kaiserbacteria bacterium]|nr:nucleoside monophosphate kinase [Candidatus Kaiserbacteria bacterium]
MKPKTVIFIGPQGSGKGTQIQQLDQVLKEKDPARPIVDIQTGRRFRALAAREEGFTEEHVGKTLDSGVLQPLFLSVMLWGEAMQNHVDPDCHLLIDGFPRTVREARVLETALSFYSREQVDIINLDTPEEVVKKRMESRARADDTPESIKARLEWYRTETLPVIEYYRGRDDTTVHDINGQLSIEEVHEEILNALDLK